jgi:hypothetical protein
MLYKYAVHVKDDKRILEKLTDAQLVNKLPPFMEPEG